jgi:quinol-cytochrome oxidoreductase complex cytochrome b subunit
MMRGSTMPQEISLQEKRVYVPTHMILKLILHVSVHEHIILTFEVGSSSATPNINEAHVIQEPDVPNDVIDEEEDQPRNLESRKC